MVKDFPFATDDVAVLVFLQPLRLLLRNSQPSVKGLFLLIAAVAHALFWATGSSGVKQRNPISRKGEVVFEVTRVFMNGGDARCRLHHFFAALSFESCFWVRVIVYFSCG